jgi:hypothetical protein
MIETSTYSKFLALDVGTTILAYQGVCTHEVVVRLSKDLEGALALAAGSRFKKVFSIFIELIQNIKHYSAETQLLPDGSESGIGIIRVSEESLCFTVTAGNCITKEAFKRIEAKCTVIKNIPTSELRAFYNAQIKQTQENTSKGAGVGFIDIAMKASGNWEYEFYPLENDRVFFVITAYIAKGKVADDEAKPA